MSSKNSIKYAYIIFLIICVIYYFVSEIFNFNFQNWERIVCAATIASYFFTGASSKQVLCQISSKLICAIKKSNEKAKDIKTRMEENPEKNTHDIEEIESIIKENNEKIEKYEQSNRNQHKWSLALNITGFLSFFCILTFKGIYRLFENEQEVYTLFAFIVVLITDAYEEYVVDNHGWLFNQENMED